MKKLLLLMHVFFLCALALADASASGDARDIPERVTIEDPSCKDVAELAKKYDAEKKLPDSVVVEGKSCSRSELAQCLLSIIDKVCANCDKEGCPEISEDDRARLAALHEALESDLSQYEGYLERRETIEKMLARKEVPFLYQIGVNGFLRGEGVSNFRLPSFSYEPGHSEGRFLFRVKPYTYWHPTGYLDIHLEGQEYGFVGGSQHSSRFSLYQGFIEAKLPEREWLALKAGRQEFSYGSTFILGPNSFFDGLAFDALRLQVRPVAPLSIDFLAGWYAPPFSAGLKGDLEGIYATYAFSDGNAVEGYVFRDTGFLGHHPGEHLDIWGLRGTIDVEPVSIEFEPVYESGRILDPAAGMDDDISAYGGHVDLTLEAEPWGYQSKLFISYAIGSGSKDAARGGSLGKEFRNPDNDSSLVGDMSVIGDLSGVTVNGHHASGIQDYTLGFGVDITKALNFTATGHYFLANAVEDGSHKDIGLETDFTATYGISENLSLIIGYDRFFTGRFFQDASGRKNDIDYGYAMLQYNFAVTRPRKSRI